MAAAVGCVGRSLEMATLGRQVQTGHGNVKLVARSFSNLVESERLRMSGGSKQQDQPLSTSKRPNSVCLSRQGDSRLRRFEKLEMLNHSG